MASTALPTLPDYLSPEILLNPEKREFPEFDVVRLLHTVFEPTKGCRVCILIDFDEPAEHINPHFPALRSGPTAAPGASLQKQIPSSRKIGDDMDGKPPEEKLDILEDLFMSMRKDVGNDVRSLKRRDLLKLFVNDIPDS